MLGIGCIAGGPETRKTSVGQHIDRLMKIVVDERGPFTVGTVSAVNVVFHVPGSVVRDVGYQGFRDGKFSRKDMMLMIQVAVPQELVVCQDTDVITSFLFNALREANRIASKYFKKKGLEYSQPKYLSLVDAVEAKFKSP